MGWGNPKIVDWKEIEQNINSMVMPTHFIGVYDDFPELQLMYRGDIVIIKDRTYMYTGKEWEELVSTISEPVWEAPKPQVTYLHNCPNCGAPMHNHKCSYCGTEDYGK